jgi:UDP-glucose 4-epimerase
VTLSLEELSDRFRGNKVLVTGGLGFIGSNLARGLVPGGAEVTLVDSLGPRYGGNRFNVAGLEAALRIEVADIGDESILRPLVRGQDVIFNLAGQTSHIDSMQDPLTDLEMNARCQLTFLEVCRSESRGARIVFASTRQLYGRPRYLPVDEEHGVAPLDVNGIHKAAGESYHLLYGAVHGFRVTALRLTNTYGPRMRVRDARQTFLGVWLKALVRGEPFEIYGNGVQRRDFNYVDDAVAAFLLAASSEEAVGRVFNLGDAHPIALRDLADLLVRLNGSGTYRFVPFPEERRRIDIGDYVGDFSKIRELLGWEPAISLEEGLRRSLAYYRRFGEEYW